MCRHGYIPHLTARTSRPNKQLPLALLDAKSIAVTARLECIEQLGELNDLGIPRLGVTDVPNVMLGPVAVAQ